MRGKSYHMNFTDFLDVDRKYVSQGLWKCKLKRSIVDSIFLRHYVLIRCLPERNVRKTMFLVDESRDLT